MSNEQTNELTLDNVTSADVMAIELAQRKAKVYASSTLVPEAYRNNIPNVMIAMNMAHRLGADAMMVMQNLYVVHGMPGWSAKFLIATFNQTRKYGTIRYDFSGVPGKMDYGCQAVVNELSTGEEHKGTRVTMQMAHDEGWSTKKGSKWLTMPDQMLRYRAATFLIRGMAPEISMGLHTVDEIEDFTVPPKSYRNVSKNLPSTQPHNPMDAIEVDPIKTYSERLDVCESDQAAVEILEEAKKDNTLTPETLTQLYDHADKLFA